MAKLEHLPQTVLFHHPFDRFPIDPGFPRRSPHVAVVPLKKLDQEAPLKRGDRRLLRMFERTRFAGS